MATIGGIAKMEGVYVMYIEAHLITAIANLIA